jgi:hypothetical protein
VNTRRRMTVAVLRRRCHVWQERLRLLDWTVDVSFSRLHAMGESVGRCDITNAGRRRAHVTLLDPRDAVSSGEIRYDLEYLLVHELLHLPMHDVLPDLDAERPDGLAAERMIDSVAEALVRAYARS